MKYSYLKLILSTCLIIIFPSMMYSNSKYSASHNNQQSDVYYLISNNIFNRFHAVGSDSFISLHLNEVNERFNYLSTEINFEMEGDKLKVFEADNGVPYILPTGSSVVAKGESPAGEGESVIPLKDIRDLYRKQLPDIGATDYFTDDETSTHEMKSNHVRIYYYNQKLIIESIDKIGKIEICDLAGKLIFSETVLSRRFERNFNLIGLYIVSVRGKHQKVKKVLF